MHVPAPPDPQFAVVFTYSLDGDTAVYLFTQEDAAKEFLKDNYETMLRDALEDDESCVLGDLSEDRRYASLYITGAGVRQAIKMRIGKIYC